MTNEKLSFFCPANRGFLKKVSFAGLFFGLTTVLSACTQPLIGVEKIKTKKRVYVNQFCTNKLVHTNSGTNAHPDIPTDPARIAYNER